MPKEYHNLINEFEKRFADQLPLYWDVYDFKIELEPNITLKFRPLYGISQEELLII